MVLALLGACGPGFRPPAPDTCSSPSSDGVASLDVLGSSGLAGSLPQYLRGPQGSPMVIYTIAVGGDRLPSCLQQSTQILDGPVVLAHDSVPLRTYGNGTGVVTMAHYVVINSTGALTVTVRVTVGGLTSQKETALNLPDFSVVVPVDLGGNGGHD